MHGAQSNHVGKGLRREFLPPRQRLFRRRALGEPVEGEEGDVAGFRECERRLGVGVAHVGGRHNLLSSRRQ